MHRGVLRACTELHRSALRLLEAMGPLSFGKNTDICVRGGAPAARSGFGVFGKSSGIDHILADVAP